MKLRALAPWVVLGHLAAAHRRRPPPHPRGAAPSAVERGGPGARHSRARPHRPALSRARPTSPARAPAAATTGWWTCSRSSPPAAIAALARTPEEQELARQARRLADHAVDLALADSIRRIAEESPELTAEQKALLAAKQKAQAALEAAQRREDDLAARVFAASGEAQDRLADQHDVAAADKELAQDELEAAAERLARAGGDPQARIRRLQAAFEAAQKDAAEAETAAITRRGRRPPPPRRSARPARGSLLDRVPRLVGAPAQAGPDRGGAAGGGRARAAGSPAGASGSASG